MFDREFFQNLLKLSQQDLSQAHLHQHFSTAKSYAMAFDYPSDGPGTWSADKPQDTLTYNNGTVTGKKYWISGLDSCEWAVVPVKNVGKISLAVIQKQYLETSPNLTQGLENTCTVHFSCDQAPAVILGDRNDPRTWHTGHKHQWCFVTNHLGIATAVFNDIDRFTGSNFLYNKNKTKLDIEILHQLWKDQFDHNVEPDWNRNNLIYAFAKKVVTEVAQLVLELTGSGLYEIDHPSHQRYQDILIYSTHMRNTNSAIQDIQHWSF
jgi:hypothetical protein